MGVAAVFSLRKTPKNASRSAAVVSILGFKLQEDKIMFLKMLLTILSGAFILGYSVSYFDS